MKLVWKPEKPLHNSGSSLDVDGMRERPSQSQGPLTPIYLDARNAAWKPSWLRRRGHKRREPATVIRTERRESSATPIKAPGTPLSIAKEKIAREAGQQRP